MSSWQVSCVNYTQIKAVFVQGGLFGLHRGGRTFFVLGLQGRPDGYLVRNIFERSFTEELTRAVEAIFEGGLKFSASETREKFYSKYSAVYIEEYRFASPSTQYYQKLEGKTKQDSSHLYWV